jgi:hypothetical protein
MQRSGLSEAGGRTAGSLEAEAAASGLSLSYLIRKILISHFIQPLTERASGADAGASH